MYTTCPQLRNGLGGTGSKDIIVRDTFVPDYRTLDVAKVLSGQAAIEAGRDQPLYRMPWSTMFPCAVSAGVVGIAEGVLRHAVEYQQGRVNAIGAVQASDPYSRTVIGEAAADIRSARAQLIFNVGELYEAVCAGHDVTLELLASSWGRPLRTREAALGALARGLAEPVSSRFPAD